MPFTSITALCLQRLGNILKPGDWALDATAGNGHDTRSLARLVGPGGRVWAIDLQAAAVEATDRQLQQAGCRAQVTLIQGDHRELSTLLPPEAKNALRAIVFNLGYLPGGDKSITTEASSTLAALDSALACLRPGGLLAVVCYPGHAAGAQEAEAVENWMRAQARSPGFELHIDRPGPTRRPAPFLLSLSREC